MPVAVRALLLLAAVVAGAVGGLLGSFVHPLTTGILLPVGLLLASPRPEGDLVVPGSTAGYLWLFGGTLLAAGCMTLPYGRPPRPGAEPSATAGGGR